MPEASSRILVDREVVRLDGRPFFTFGPRVFLTPQDRLRDVLASIASDGFTAVGTPPCSPGTLPLVKAVFDAAEEANLMVVLHADPRLPDHGRYLADHFSHRRALHSYVLPPRGPGRDGLEGFLRERDNIRAKDLFHPIVTPLGAGQFTAPWLKAQDYYCPTTPQRRVVNRRILQPRPGQAIGALRPLPPKVPARPFLCLDLPVGTGDEERRAGLYSDDPWVDRFPHRAADWFPWLANLARSPRRDFLAPDPEILRLQIYELLFSGCRGILLDFFEMLGGQMPYTGQDRYLEAAILAREVGLFRDFFAEGHDVAMPLETGHPRLAARTLRHGFDSLIVLRMEGYEEDFFVDEAHMERTEISLHLEQGGGEVHAWRMDFPKPRELEIMRDSVGSLRFLVGPLELTGLVLVTTGTRRSAQLVSDFAELLPTVARHAVRQLEIRHGKALLIEGELREMSAGIDNSERLAATHRILCEARAALLEGLHGHAYELARSGCRRIRQLIKYQVARALASPYHERSELLALLRMSYHTLPRFYREGAQETARAFTDLT